MSTRFQEQQIKKRLLAGGRIRGGYEGYMYMNELLLSFTVCCLTDRALLCCND